MQAMKKQNKLIGVLEKQTQALKKAYIEKTKKWASDEFDRIRRFIDEYRNGMHREYGASTLYNGKNAERFYYSLPSYILCGNHNKQKYIDIQVEKAEKHYNNSIVKLSHRILKKGLDQSNISLETSYLDPNISTIITDGNKTVRAYTIIASGEVQKPHYRYLVK